MLLISYWYKSIWKVLSLLYIRHMTLFNQSKYVQIKSCDLLEICIYTLCPTFHYPPHQIPSHTLMWSLTPAQHNCILKLLDKGQSCPAISSITGISVCSISNICSKILFITFPIYWWPSMETFTCRHPICYSPYHFSEGWKCCWGH